MALHLARIWSASLSAPEKERFPWVLAFSQEPVLGASPERAHSPRLVLWEPQLSCGLRQTLPGHATLKKLATSQNGTTFVCGHLSPGLSQWFYHGTGLIWDLQRRTGSWAAGTLNSWVPTLRSWLKPAPGRAGSPRDGINEINFVGCFSPFLWFIPHFNYTSSLP